MSDPSGLWLVLAVLVPFVGMRLGLLLGGRWAQRVALLTLLIGLGISLAIAAAFWSSGEPLRYALGGWAPPLGIELRADLLSVVMMLAVSVVVCGIGIYACADFATPSGENEARAPLSFWLLLQAVWGSLNLVFVSGDLFTLYVALELLTFAGVPLVCLDGRGETLRAALRYLLFALAGSLLYLLGAVLLYGAYGTLDIALLAARVRPEPIAWVVTALMTVGLMAKTALFPLHIWLPIKRINSDLPNDLRKLLSRTLTMIEKYFEGNSPQCVFGRHLDEIGEPNLKDLAKQTVHVLERDLDYRMERLLFSHALDGIWHVINFANKLIEDEAPWILWKTKNIDKLSSVLYTLAEALRIIAICLFPFIPSAAEEIWEQLNIQEKIEDIRLDKRGKWGLLEPGTKINKGKSLFPRIETTKKS